MQIEILARGAFGSALIHLDPGESFVSESGAMFRASSNMDIDVTTKSKGKGGLLAGVKRLLGGDNFFFSTYRTTDGGAGEVGLSPTLGGEVREIAMDGVTSWVCAGGSYMASSSELQLDVQFQGLRGLFSGENLFFMHVQGEGSLLVNAYGRISEVEVDGELIIDTGHLVAFEETLTYTTTKTGGSWVTSFLAGEGIVMHFKGRGRVFVQSHNAKEFGTRLGRLLPPRRG
ncbi:MAG: TIGR00266 family protein [bacterium]|nr:TIGR00266 family protein [bacterium]